MSHFCSRNSIAKIVVSIDSESSSIEPHNDLDVTPPGREDDIFFGFSAVFASIEYPSFLFQELYFSHEIFLSKRMKFLKEDTDPYLAGANFKGVTAVIRW